MTEETNDVTPETTETVSYEEFKKVKEEAEKYKGYFKKEKAKQKDQPSSIDFDPDEFEKKVTSKIEFYSTNPDAKEYKEDIENYTNKGLTYEEAFNLVAASKNPDLLKSKQSKNVEDAQTRQLTGVADIDSGRPDYDNWGDDDIRNSSSEDFEKYMAYMKRKG